MIYQKHSNGKIYFSNNTSVVDILSNEELVEKIKSQSFLKRIFKPIRVI